MHKQSLDKPEEFWSEILQEFHWQKKPDPERLFDYNFDVNKGNIFINFCPGAVTNVCFNVLDRMVRKGHGDRVAYYW